MAYFAALREQRGLSQEGVETAATTPEQLYEELRRVHGFTLDSSLIRAAVNGSFAPMEEPLEDGDSVVLMPPVAGG